MAPRGCALGFRPPEPSLGRGEVTESTLSSVLLRRSREEGLGGTVGLGVFRKVTLAAFVVTALHQGAQSSWRSHLAFASS